jgi:hypothetical protein
MTPESSTYQLLLIGVFLGWLSHSCVNKARRWYKENEDLKYFVHRKLRGEPQDKDNDGGPQPPNDNEDYFVPDGPQNPTVETAPSPGKVSEAAERAQAATINAARARLDHLQRMTAAEASGRDLGLEIDNASREYGELFFQKYRTAPPEWR